MYFLMALISGVVGAAPLLIKQRFAPFFGQGIISTLVLWLMYYMGTPSTVWPLFGLMGFMVLVQWIIAAFIDMAIDEDFGLAQIVPIAGVVVFIGSGVLGCGLLRSSDYAQMIGEVEEREWTQDVQPKDPKHMRMSSIENAVYLIRYSCGYCAD